MSSRNHSLIQWALSNGISLEAIHIETNNTYQFAAAAQNIEPEEKILSIPLSLTLNEQSARVFVTSDLPAFNKLPFEEQSEWAIPLYLLILNHSDAPSHTPYLRALPTHFPTHPLCYDESEIARIEGSHLLWQTDQLHRKLKLAYEKFIPASKILKNISFEEFRWAYLVNSTRGFFYTDNMLLNLNENILVPVADTLNHSETANARVEFDRESKQIDVIANEPISTDEEVTLFYGYMNSTEYLLRYGFLEPQVQPCPTYFDLISKGYDTKPADHSKSPTIDIDYPDSIMELFTSVRSEIPWFHGDTIEPSKEDSVQNQYLPISTKHEIAVHESILKRCELNLERFKIHHSSIMTELSSETFLSQHSPNLRHSLITLLGEQTTLCELAELSQYYINVLSHPDRDFMLVLTSPQSGLPSLEHYQELLTTMVKRELHIQNRAKILHSGDQ